MRTLLHSAFFVFFFTAVGFPQIKFFENNQATRTGPDAGMFPDTPTRMKLDLSGSWNYSVDGKEWRQVSVPSAYDWVGKMTLRRTFEIKPEMLDRYTFSLVAYGINYQSEITINGNFVGRHYGGYSSFVMPIQSGVLQVGNENSIQISVDNELTPKTTLPLRQPVGGWRTYGGIFRDIYLLATPKLFIEQASAKVTLSNDKTSCSIAVHGEIVQSSENTKPEPVASLGFLVEVYEKLSGNFVGKSSVSLLTPQPNKTVAMNTTLTLNAPKLWSPEVPDLYVVKCKIVRITNNVLSNFDEYDFDIGVRDFRWNDGKLFINGTQTRLNGILWQEDHPTFGSAMTYEAMERDIAQIKALGANLVRFLYPPHPYVLNLCDRYGLMVMEDVPLVRVPSEILVKEYFQDLAMVHVKEMVARDKRHVAIIAWGIGDEFETTSSLACDYVNNARNSIKSADERFVYFATNKINDPCFEYVDMIAFNSYRDDAKEFREVLKQCVSQHPGKPIIVARYGKNIQPNNRSGYSDPRSMESQARMIAQFYEVLKETKIAGSVLWSFGDWRSDRPALTTNASDPYLQSMGIVSYEREKRPAFEVVRTLFAGEKLQALPIGNYAATAPLVFVVAGLVVLISFAFLYNSNRRFRDSVNRALFRMYNFFTDVRDQRIITYRHSIFLAVVIAVTWATILSSIFSHYRQSLFLDNMLSQFMLDGVKEWFVRLVWNPPKFILVVTSIVLLKILLLTLLVKACSMFVRTHVYFYHSMAVTLWSMLPYVVLIPLAMILYRIIESSSYVIPIAVFLVIVNVWVFLRLLKGISIIYDVFPVKVYASGILFVFVCVAALYGYFDYTRSTSVYLKYLLQTVTASM